MKALKPLSLIGGLATLVSCVEPTSVPTPPEASFAEVVDSLRAEWGLPALAAAIVTTSGIEEIAATGVRRAGGTTPVTLGDRFHIGSNLKAITAGFIGKLVDQGEIPWTLTLADAFPDYAAGMHAQVRDVTLEELLSQQSGIMRDPTITFHDPTALDQRDSLVRWVTRQPPVSARGTFYYSNVNYMLAAAMVERLLGVSYETVVVAELTGPLGMSTFGFGSAGTPGVEDEPWGHGVAPAGTRFPVSPGPSADNPAVYGPAGRAHMSIGDWAKWIQVVLDAKAGDDAIWTTATADKLVAPGVVIGGVDAYAMGWITTRRPWAGPTQRVLTHDGTNTLHYSVAWLALDQGWGVIAVTNQGGVIAASALDATAGRLIERHMTGR